jgi:hypothetical protein
MRRVENQVGKSRDIGFVFRLFARGRTIFHQHPGLMRCSKLKCQSRTICGFSGKVDNARFSVHGDVRAINLNELNAVFDRRSPVAAAILGETQFFRMLNCSEANKCINKSFPNLQ